MTDHQEAHLDNINTCPVCGKMFFNEKALYGHILHIHRDGQYMSYNMNADLYKRWQDRLTRPQQ